MSYRTRDKRIDGVLLKPKPLSLASSRSSSKRTPPRPDVLALACFMAMSTRVPFGRYKKPLLLKS